MPTRRRLLQGLAAAAALPVASRAPATQAPPTPGDCVFCRIEAGTEDAVVLWRDEQVVAIADRFPLAPGHALLMPRRHYQDVYALPSALASRLYAIAPVLARTLKRAFAADGITCIQNNERAGGQSVFHFHMHFVPRTAGIQLFQPLPERVESSNEERARLFAPVLRMLEGRA